MLVAHSLAPLVSPRASAFLTRRSRANSLSARRLRKKVPHRAAAVLAASGVKRGVKDEGGATPSIAGGLDPAPHGAGRPAGVAPPSSVTDKQDGPLASFVEALPILSLDRTARAPHHRDATPRICCVATSRRCLHPRWSAQGCTGTDALLRAEHEGIFPWRWPDLRRRYHRPTSWTQGLAPWIISSSGRANRRRRPIASTRITLRVRARSPACR